MTRAFTARPLQTENGREASTRVATLEKLVYLAGIQTERARVITTHINLFMFKGEVHSNESHNKNEGLNNMKEHG